MAFTQQKLDRIGNQSRGIFDQYIYKTTTDTSAEVLAEGYFTENRFLATEPDSWKGGQITCVCSDITLIGFVNSAGTGVSFITPKPVNFSGLSTQDQSLTNRPTGTVIEYDTIEKSCNISYDSGVFTTAVEGFVKVTYDFNVNIITGSLGKVEFWSEYESAPGVWAVIPNSGRIFAFINVLESTISASGTSDIAPGQKFRTLARVSSGNTAELKAYTLNNGTIAPSARIVVI